MIAQLIYILFVLVIEYVIYIEYTKKKSSTSAMLFWVTFWALSALVILIPKAIDSLASLVGLQSQKGIDLLLDVAVVAIFYLIWKLFTRLERMERSITSLTRTIAYVQRDKEDSDTHRHVQ